MSPHVSICIPAYNNLALFQRCMESILSQDYDNYEIIVTDDSSNDEIEMFLKNKNIPKLKYQKNKVALGSPRNWNEALDLATGELVKIMHHDDWFADNGALSKFVNVMSSNPNCGFAYSENYNVQNEKIVNHISTNPNRMREIKEDKLNLLLGNTMGSPSTVIHRSNDLRYDPNLIWFVDLDFLIQLIDRYSSDGMIYIDKVLLCMGMGDYQISSFCENNPYIILKEYFYLLNKWGVNKIRDHEKLNVLIMNSLSRFYINDLEDLREYTGTIDLPNDLKEQLEIHTSTKRYKPLYLLRKWKWKLTGRIKYKPE